MLQNVYENCIRILEEKKHRQLRVFVILWKKWKKLASSSIKQNVKKIQKQCVHPRNIAAVAESACEARSISNHHRSQQLNISETSLRWILHKDLSMTPYKVQLVQELKPIDHPMSFRFAKWACDRLTEDADFGKKKKKINFSEEAHFDLGGYVNKRNCRIWCIENLHAYIEKPTHPKRVTIWCGFWPKGIIGPFFFENEQGAAVKTKFYSQKLKRMILATFGFNRMAQRATQPKLYSMFCALLLKIALSAAELMSFGHLGVAIWPVGPLFVGCRQR